MIFETSSPAILPASMVAYFCDSLKYAGTVITAFFTTDPGPRNFSADYLRFARIKADICSGVYVASDSLVLILIYGIFPFPLSTIKGHNLISS